MISRLFPSVVSTFSSAWKDKRKLLDIIDAIARIEAYSVSSDDDFLSDPKTQDAIHYNLIIMVRQQT